jgi:hypothetical protein
MGSILELKRDDLEIAAKLFASNRAEEITRVIVDECLRGRGVDRDETRIVEDHVRGLLGAFLKLGLIEFTEKYCAEMERLAMEAWKNAEVALARTPNTSILHRANGGSRTMLQNFCNRCGHIHEGVDSCGFPMGGAGVCGCTAEVRV